MGAWLTACVSLQDRRETASAIAQDGNFALFQLEAGKFRLQTYYRGQDLQGGTLAVYIEGDGQAWKQKNVLSDDPTPVDPVALKLAVQDPSVAVLYIARPCQYLGAEELKNCPPQYWSTHRYAEEVIAAINAAVDWGVNQSGAVGVSLYGYSGGGAVAALVAARRQDVVSLITIAANLDHVSWTRLQGISPLSGSLNPADMSDELKDIPQVHFAGSDDRIVPVSVLESYREHFTDKTRITLKVIPGFDHHCCWTESWPDLLLKASQEFAEGSLQHK